MKNNRSIIKQWNRVLYYIDFIVGIENVRSDFFLETQKMLHHIHTMIFLSENMNMELNSRNSQRITYSANIYYSNSRYTSKGGGPTSKGYGVYHPRGFHIQGVGGLTSNGLGSNIQEWVERGQLEKFPQHPGVYGSARKKFHNIQREWEKFSEFFDILLSIFVESSQNLRFFQ